MPATAVRPGIICGKGLSGWRTREFVNERMLTFSETGRYFGRKKRLVLSDVTSKIYKILHEILLNTF